MEGNKYNKTQKKFYDNVFSSGDVFDDTVLSESVKYFTNNFINKVIRYDGQKILEVGCGSGLLTYFLLKKKVKVTAIDISENGIKCVTRQFAKEIKNGKLTPICSDIVDYLTNSKEKFDIIIGSGIIHHLDKKIWGKFFSLAYKRLKTNGVIAFAPEPNAGGFFYYLWFLAKYVYKMFGINYDWDVEKGSLNMKTDVLKQYFKKAGFIEQKILPFQVIPHFRLNALAQFDKRLVNNIEGKYSMYICIIGIK